MQKKRGVCKDGNAHNRIPGSTGLRLSLTCITGTLACLLHRVPYFYTRSRNVLHYIGKNTSMSCQGTLIDQESSLAQHTACRKPRNKSTYKTSLLHGSHQKSDLITRPPVQGLRENAIKSKADQPHSKNVIPNTNRLPNSPVSGYSHVICYDLTENKEKLVCKVCLWFSITLSFPQFILNSTGHKLHSSP